MSRHRTVWNLIVFHDRQGDALEFVPSPRTITQYGRGAYIRDPEEIIADSVGHTQLLVPLAALCPIDNDICSSFQVLDKAIEGLLLFLAF
jgi:hypothetical protein